MFCNQCGAATQEGQRFCSGCGRPLGAVPVVPPQNRTSDYTKYWEPSGS